ncbi:MAG: CHAT domain-containing tetratricopeptide repeat protein [Prolixibacteraceae bacterium]
MYKRIILLFFSFSICMLVFADNIKKSNLDSIRSAKLQKDGIIAGRHGDFELALENFKIVYQLRQKMFGLNSSRLAPPLINMGIQYKNLGYMEKAIDSYKMAESLCINSPNDNFALGTVYVNLGIVYKLAGDYNRALEYQRNAYRILQKDSVKYNSNFQDSKYNIAETQLKLGYNVKVIQFAQANIISTLPKLKPRLFDLIALAYRNVGKLDLSEKNYLNAIKSWIDYLGENNVELISEYLAYSSLLMEKKQYDRALEYSKKALLLVPKYYSEKSTASAEVQSNFGNYYYYRNLESSQFEDYRIQRKKYLEQSIQYYQNAIVALVDSFKSLDPFIDPPLRHVISEIQLVDCLKKKSLAMEKLADIYLSEFNHENSYKYFNASLNSLEKAIQLIHQLQIGFENEDSKLFLAQNQESTFYSAIKISYKLYNQTHNPEFIKKAFDFSERGKSSNLLASVKDIQAKEFGGIPDSLLRKEKELKSSIASYTSKLMEENSSEEPDSQRVNTFSAKIFKFNEEYNRLIDSFEESFPQYYSLKYENKVIGVNEIQSKLNSRQALLEYFIHEPENDETQGELYRFVITKDSVSFTNETIDNSYSANIQSVHDFLTSPNYLFTKKKDFVDYSTSAYGLYKKLLEPVADKLSGKDITVIPHNKLSYIPFDALLSQMPDTSVMNFRNLNYLVKDYAINYSYSATLLYDYFNQKKKGSESLLIFAPKYNSEAPRIDPETSISYYLRPLSGAKDEVKAINHYIKAETFVDERAQENVFKEEAPEFDILHLAMHTIMNDSLPMFSKLVFSKPNDKSDDDGYLNTYEIYNMKLNARLAVLSACETGTGKLQKGEGVMSMARGFIYAGCPSIIMTLWQVEDKSGVKIMDDFYHFLSNGKRKDVALRLAKLRHLENSDPLTAHPHFWLGYVNIGNPEPLYTSKNIYFILILFLVVMLVFADWYLRKRSKSKRRKM